MKPNLTLVRDEIPVEPSEEERRLDRRDRVMGAVVCVSVLVLAFAVAYVVSR